MRFVVGNDRSQISLFPERLDDYLDEEECRALTLRETLGDGSTAAVLDAAHVVTFVPVIKSTQTDAEGGSSSRLFVVRLFCAELHEGFELPPVARGPRF